MTKIEHVFIDPPHKASVIALIKSPRNQSLNRSQFTE